MDLEILIRSSYQQYNLVSIFLNQYFLLHEHLKQLEVFINFFSSPNSSITRFYLVYSLIRCVNDVFLPKTLFIE